MDFKEVFTLGISSFAAKRKIKAPILWYIKRMLIISARRLTQNGQEQFQLPFLLIIKPVTGKLLKNNYFGIYPDFSLPLAMLSFRSSAIFLSEEMLTFSSKPISSTNEFIKISTIKIKTVPIEPYNLL